MIMRVIITSLCHQCIDSHEGNRIRLIESREKIGHFHIETVKREEDSRGFVEIKREKRRGS